MLLVRFIKKTFPQRFLLAKLTRVPILGALIDRWLFRGDDIIYLPRDEVVRIGEVVESQEEMVLPSQVVEHFIDRTNCLWIMNSCICREATGCKDYPHNLGCLFMGEAAMGINPKLGRRVTREEAKEHIRRCQEAGLVHLIGRNKLDTVWLGVGPGNKLLTVCNCCPCCCLWKMLPVISPRIGDKVTRMPGVEIVVSDSCTGCGTCSQGICFVDAIRLEGGRAVHSDACRGCGRCVSVCPEGAVRISIKSDLLLQGAIERLSPLFDLA
jgi:ferredoxin